MTRSTRPRQFVPGLLFGLAGGIAAGTLLLAPVIPGFSTLDSARQHTEEQQQAAAAATAEKVATAQVGAADAVIAAHSSNILNGILDGVPVGVVALPGADPTAVQGITTLVSQAGGKVSATVTLTASLFSQAAADQVETLVTSVIPAGTTLETAHTNPGFHTGQVVASALMVSPTGQDLAQPDERAIIAHALEQSGYGTIDPGQIPARVVIIVTGTPTPDTAFDSAAQVNFLLGFEQTGKAVVAAGPAASAAPDGIIGQLRQQGTPGMSTIDSIGHTFAQLAAVAAARNELEGAAGNFGAATNAQAPAPEIPHTPPPGVRPATPVQPAGDQPSAQPQPPQPAL